MDKRLEPLADPVLHVTADGPTDPGRLRLDGPGHRLLQDWRLAHVRAVAYLAALGVAAAERDGLAREAVGLAMSEPWEEGNDAVDVTLAQLRTLLLRQRPVPPRPWDGGIEPFLAWRLGTGVVGASGALRTAPVSGGRFDSMPPLQRTSMAPEPMERRLLYRWFGRLRGRVSGAAARKAFRRRRRALAWTRVAHRRRLLLSVLVLLPTVVASGFMVSVLPRGGGTWLEVAIVVVFGVLFGWISIGFWAALMGFWCLVRGDRFAISRAPGTSVPFPGAAPDPAVTGRPTAIVMPICNEPVDRVFAGLRAIEESLAGIGAADQFHFFVLSDTADAETIVREEEAWAAWARDVDGFDRIFYRRRRVRLRRKSGNVADFCRRWGARYPFMVMLDADSVMQGSTLVRLVELMRRHPDVGIIQTVPIAVQRRSLFARVQQFSSRAYGPMFSAGLHFWQLGDGQYWGHNAIIRTAPFIEHCALPRLPGKPPLGGEILSHDFVEAALMGRAGWTTWLAYDLGGSWEEVPSTLLEEMSRDRRWCQGNLQHLRLLFTEGLFGAHRTLFLNGALSYVSALLWATFLLLSTWEAVANVFFEPDYFPSGPSLFPEWPIWRPNWALALLAVTGMILFVPKILSVLLIAVQGQARAFGGILRLLASVVLDVLLSSLLAPIRMAFHSRFVFTNLIGRTVVWRSQTREDAETSWGDAIRAHGFDTLFASAWGALLYWLNPEYFWWVLPIIGALVLAIPVSVLASRVAAGARARDLGFFLTPEETDPPPEVRAVAARLAAAPPGRDDVFVATAVDPYVNALHKALLRPGRKLRASIRSAHAALLDEVVHKGPAEIDAEHRRMLLRHPDLVAELHRRVWDEDDPEIAALWDLPVAPPSTRGGAKRT
ncbi:MAG: glucans biosynthesis glucosyltransferase MdoH [Myxococcales bacterium]|jgi:membrane glycosyltransferase|nr:glucans biosynthesis glucosyltransferase MdoH [Myxococcales bacterium]